MKTFSTFVAEATNENEKLVQKLEKTRVSMHSHWKRGGEARHQHGRQLINRYNDLTDRLRDNEGGEKHWKDYCKSHNYATDHRGHDLYS